MHFEAALTLLKYGYRIYRSAWSANAAWIELQMPDSFSKMTLPFIYLATGHGDKVPWLASQTDILSHDWQVHESYKPPLGPAKLRLAYERPEEAATAQPTAQVKQ